jgi:hypothetical protein
MGKHKGITYLQMIMKACRDIGRLVGKTEHWNSFAFIRQDLFGFIDAIALGKKETVALQSTDMSKRWPHINDIFKNPNAKRWLQCGNKIEVWCWRKIIVGKYKNGKTRKQWTPQIDHITIEDFKCPT